MERVGCDPSNGRRGEREKGRTSLRRERRVGLHYENDNFFLSKF